MRRHPSSSGETRGEILAFLVHFFSFQANLFRNFATFGATTDRQYPPRVPREVVLVIFLAPGVPVHGLAGFALEVRGGLLREPVVGHGRSRASGTISALWVYLPGGLCSSVG